MFEIGFPRMQRIGILIVLATTTAASSDLALAQSSSRPRTAAPTLVDVAYGSHPRQKLDFYRAESADPTPVVLYLHGGGWLGGSKSPFYADPYLLRKISVVAIGYRFVSESGDLAPNGTYFVSGGLDFLVPLMDLFRRTSATRG